MNIPKIFIIILNYNGIECLKTTLVSVLKLDYSNFEVVLVDNNSSDGSFEMVRREFSKITLIRNSENLGFPAGNNIGIKYTLERGADYVFLLNYDTEVKKNTLSPLVKTMEEEKKIGAVSPVILKNKRETIWFSGGKINWFRMKSHHLQNKIVKKYYKSDYLCGCAMLIRSEMFKKAGLLDERFFLYWEDVDFSRRIRKAGYGLAVCPQSQIYHFEKSSQKKERKIYWLVLSGLIFFKKNTPIYFRPWIFFYTLARKIKNKRDIKKEKTAINLIVQKAYQDFKKIM